MIHTPVMLNEVINALNPTAVEGAEAWFVDATVGAGGHTEALLNAGAKVVGVDQDAEILAYTKERLKDHGDNLRLIQGNFGNVATHLETAGIEKVGGVLADLGVSSLQLDQAERGFSFLRDGPLDMRMDPAQETTARDVVNTYPEKQLVEIFSEYGEARFSKTIAKEIVIARKKKHFETTGELAELIKGVYVAHLNRERFRIHPATQVFQAIRIAVNQELAQLENFLAQVPGVLVSGGRLAVISFHSLEDRIVKHAVKDQKTVLRPVTKKPLMASKEETKHNPRARSAKLRVAERV